MYQEGCFDKKEGYTPAESPLTRVQFVNIIIGV